MEKKEYGLDTIITFGRYKGKTLKDMDKAYFNWFVTNVDSAVIPNEVLDELQDSYGLILTKKAKEINQNKIDYYRQINEEYDDYVDEYYPYRQTYEKYQGAYGLSDQFIDDVLDGDPGNYWNID